MHVLVLGATGMVGHGMLHACITDDDVEAVTVIARRAPAPTHPKVRVLLHHDFTDLTPLREEVTGVDTCHFAIGTSSAGVSETDYTRITRDYALAAANTLLDASDRQPAFVYVSGRSADSTEQTSVMWARVKGAAENALLALPMRTHILRPGYIRPLNGARASSTTARAFYTATGPLFPVLRRAFPDWATSTEAIGRAAIALSHPGNTEPTIVTSRDINRLAGM
ncbi:NAD-dependent epimerase/dehydratase family protein [Streptomyces sp. NPDC050400]|uniref:NAD-dependent epimerase/dehydratase family protein n=1 Tax=Streptomyces sp. NPDC050400 TaxID=3365610 RepID=UPI0037A6DF56